MRAKKYIAMFLVVLLTLAQSACNSMKLKDAKSAADVYYANTALFQTAADVLISYNSEDIVLIDSSAPTVDDSVCVYEMSGIYIATTRPLFDAEYQEIYHAVAPLFEEVPIICISRDSTWVGFLLESRSGRTAELFYETAGNEIITGFGITDQLQINDDWYAITTSD